MKHCKKCKQNKSLDEFSIDKNTKDGKFYCCKACRTEYDQLNREKQLNYHKEKRQNELDDFKKYDKKYKGSHKNEASNYRKIKWKNDPKYRLRVMLRSRFHFELKKSNISKQNKILTLLGCTIEEFKRYIEKQFKLEMNWENHGFVWELDHIKSCSSFNLTKLEEQQRCFHFTNMQPLFKTTAIAESFGYLNEIGNREKSNK